MRSYYLMTTFFHLKCNAVFKCSQNISKWLMFLKGLLFRVERAKGIKFKRTLFHIKAMFG